MNKYWENAVVSEIIAVEYIAEGAEESMIYHRCPYDGFVMNESETVKDYCFADGTIIRAGKNELFFLPKDAKYYTRSIQAGGSYMILFALEKEVWESPFALKIRNHREVMKVFREAVNVWQQADFYKAQCMKNVYEIILTIQKELHRNYIPGDRGRMIAFAIEEIRTRFADHELSVSGLARTCGISYAYFRQLFFDKTGVNPREYITRLRIEYAERLLEDGQRSIAEIAGLCGYTEVSSFSREFTRRKGSSPLEYRKQRHARSDKRGRGN